MGDTSFLALPDLVDKQFIAAGFLGSNTLESSGTLSSIKACPGERTSYTLP